MTRLPIDCEAYYRADFLSAGESDALFDEIVGGYDVFNKVIRLADGSEYAAENATYLFCDPELTAFEKLPEVWGGRSPWPDSLARVRDRIEGQTGTRFEVARCVYYRDGSEGMAYHRDLPAYGSTAVIASISLGAEREFRFRSLSNPDEIHGLILHQGSLLIMGKGCQENYEHGLPGCEACDLPRLNITFRKFGWEDDPEG